MLVRCPKCATEYDVAPDAIGEERLLRCAICYFEWRPEAPPPLRARPTSVWPVISFLALSFVILTAVGAYHLDARLFGGAAADRPPAWLAVYRRSVDQMIAYAPSLRGPAAESRHGVIFVEAGYDLVARPEGPALEIWGRIANNGGEPALTPSIEIVSRDGDGERLQRWLVWPETDVLEPGQSARFTSRMMHPLGPIADVDFYFDEH